MITNLSARMDGQLPAELVSFIHRAGEAAVGQGMTLYLVGGVVRDLLLGQHNLDIDLAVEGDAIVLAKRLAEGGQMKATTHPRFGTAKLRWGRWSIDIATARSETYAMPGALPQVTPSTITGDLFRRDFTVNAMAICLSKRRRGELVDPHNGQDDLERRLIRILHERSFTDDATRIWRGLRYEQRLGFRLEETTLKMLRRDIPMLDAISADRIRYEVECILKEGFPEKALRRADELQALPRLHPALTADAWLEEKFAEARRLSSPRPPSVRLYLALLAYRLSDEEIEGLIAHIRPPRPLALTLRDTIALKSRLNALANPEIAPSRIYHILHRRCPQAVAANLLAGEPPAARQHLRSFLDRSRHLKPALTGDDLKTLGITSGPDIGAVLQELHDARLDGKIATREDEAGMARRWLSSNTGRDE